MPTFAVHELSIQKQLIGAAGVKKFSAKWILKNGRDAYPASGYKKWFDTLIVIDMSCKFRQKVRQANHLTLSVPLKLA